MDWEKYINRYEDLQLAGFKTENQAKEHWKKYGEKEGREYFICPEDFDWKFYIEEYPHLKLNTKLECINHWYNYGKKEGRIFNKKYKLKKKIAICFWGLTRSLKYTIDSLKLYFLDILNKNDVEYDIYMHTYKIDSIYTNERSSEFNIKLDFEEHNLLNPKYYMIENQDDVKEMLKLEEYRTHKDPWNNDYKTCDNFICALYSKYQVTQMLLNTEIKYDNIIFCRPDLKMINEFPINSLNIYSDEDIFYTPDFHKFGGLNDRFFVSNYKNGIIYGEAFKFLKEYSKTQNIHSETYCLNYLVKMNKLISLELKFYFHRMRANGVFEVDYRM
uniref:Uncharacterized protein n=1 Tax=viral metagenome TaxID=1070528 RepID=A0A6C0AEG9_9ZZZZ